MTETVRSNLNALRRASKEACAAYVAAVPEFMRRQNPMTVFPDQAESNLVAIVNLTNGSLLNREMVSRIHETARTRYGLVTAILKDVPSEIRFKQNWLGVEVHYMLDTTNPSPGEVEGICFSKFVDGQGISLEFFWDNQCEVNALGLYRKELKDRDIFVSQYSPLSVDGVVLLAKGSKIPQLNPLTRIDVQGLLSSMIATNVTEPVRVEDYIV